MTGGPLDGFKWYHKPLIVALVVICAPFSAVKVTADRIKNFVKR